MDSDRTKLADFRRDVGLLAELALSPFVKDEGYSAEAIQYYIVEISRLNENGSREAIEAVRAGLESVEKTDPALAMTLAAAAIEAAPADSLAETELIEEWQNLLAKRSLAQRATLYPSLAEDFLGTQKLPFKSIVAPEVVQLSAYHVVDNKRPTIEGVQTTLKEVHNFARGTGNIGLQEKTTNRLEDLDYLLAHIPT